ncbi:hypothetical protein LWF15_01355 [Kineosporia rhizophila]|uniref:flavodoxin family protein n=1 Tax=Kineosporia rhizophila TaxID=84633 RepID=UPI001E2FA5B3|nr:hypothetical protein [Kineosporia rhizophila]MCE0534145.1 hypothetical protein [Kineosporia rhizophila]
MNVLVVVESCFSNTHRFAEAVAAGLTEFRVSARVVEAAAQEWDLENVDLLVVGAPIHHRGLPNRLSRALAGTQGATPKSFGVAEWLEGMPHWEGGRAAAFDCGTGNGFINGSAVHQITRRLHQRGVEVLTSERFLVEAMLGPAVPEDLARARKWGSSLASFGGKTGETAQLWISARPQGPAGRQAEPEVLAPAKAAVRLSAAQQLAMHRPAPTATRSPA